MIKTYEKIIEVNFTKPVFNTEKHISEPLSENWETDFFIRPAYIIADEDNIEIKNPTYLMNGWNFKDAYNFISKNHVRYNIYAGKTLILKTPYLLFNNKRYFENSDFALWIRERYKPVSFTVTQMLNHFTIEEINYYMKENNLTWLEPLKTKGKENMQ